MGMENVMTEWNLSISDFGSGPKADARTTNDASGVDATGLIGEVLCLYRQEGYDDGYTRAVRDMLASLVFVSEEFLRQQEPSLSPDLRRALYAFAEHLEHRLASMSPRDWYVEGGLGI